MYNENKIYHLISTFFLTISFFLILSFFFSINKIYIPILISIFFVFSKKKIKKILFFNLLIFSILFKLIIINIGKDLTLSKLVYEKKYLYGVQNLDKEFLKQSGDLMGFLGIKENNSVEMVKIKTDKYGFRNEAFNNDFDYIFVGDSALHQHRLDQDDLINYHFNKSGLKVYNAGIPVWDFSNYFEVIKFLKKKEI